MHSANITCYYKILHVFLIKLQKSTFVFAFRYHSY